MSLEVYIYKRSVFKCFYQYSLSFWMVVNWFDCLIQGDTVPKAKLLNLVSQLSRQFVGIIVDTFETHMSVMPKNTNYGQWDTFFFFFSTGRISVYFEISKLVGQFVTHLRSTNTSKPQPSNQVPH